MIILRFFSSRFRFLWLSARQAKKSRRSATCTRIRRFSRSFLSQSLLAYKADVSHPLNWKNTQLRRKLNSQLAFCGVKLV